MLRSVYTSFVGIFLPHRLVLLSGLFISTPMELAIVHMAFAADERTVTAAWAGPAQPVFAGDTEGCDSLDIPDESARAFRDVGGRVHLVATHFIARAMVGPSLDSVRHDCRVIFRSSEDPDPSHFRDRSWLGSFYTEDGIRIAALLHSEYQAWTHLGMCAAANAEWPARANCWWNSITMAISNNEGANFSAPAPPTNLVASLPYPYIKTNTGGAFGYNSPTNILKIGIFYYAMIGDWPYAAQKYGACLIRTTDLFDGASWRAWDGTDFRIRFADPYQGRVAKPEEHVCTPVGTNSVYAPGSLSVYGGTRTYLTVEFAPDARFGASGIYISASSNLIHWSTPSLIAGTEAMLLDEPPGKWRYNYFALLDPNSLDRNFATVTVNPYLYYVRTDSVRGYHSATLMRRRIELHVGF